MQTFETYRQYLNACTRRTVCSHMPPAGPYLWTCETCGKAAPNTDSYGVNGKAQTMHCYDCCHALDVAQLLDRSKAFVSYLSSDGRTVSNWPGGKLGTVSELTVSRSGWQGSKIWRFRVRDIHGQYWSARGPGKGMYCTMRPMKDPR